MFPRVARTLASAGARWSAMGTRARATIPIEPFRFFSAASEKKSLTPDIAHLSSLFGVHKDFPKKGIVFRDMFPILRDPIASQIMFTALTHHIQSKYGKVDVIVGLDSRGFLLGPTLAMRLGAGFTPVRKVGKLPGPTLRAKYQKEYGFDEFELQVGAIKQGDRVVIVDDLLATGGSFAGAVSLVQQSGGEVLECLSLVELKDLKGRQALSPTNVHALIQY